MPATSPEQRKAMAIAEHDPDKLYSRNSGMLKMSQAQLSEFASTKGLTRGKNMAKMYGGAPAKGMKGGKTSKGFMDTPATLATKKGLKK